MKATLTCLFLGAALIFWLVGLGRIINEVEEHGLKGIFNELWEGKRQ